MYDVIIIGGGPAGIAAGVYSASCFFKKHSMKPSGFITSATRKLPFSRPLSRNINYFFEYGK